MSAASASNGSDGDGDGDGSSSGSFTALINRASRAASNLASSPPPPPPGSKEQQQQQQRPPQDPAAAVLSQLERIASLADSLGLISPNEALRDISTPSLRALFVPSLTADVLTRQRTPPAAAGAAAGDNQYGARKTALQAALVQARRFLTSVTKLDILPASTVSLLGARNELLTASSSSSSSSTVSTAAARDEDATFLAPNAISAPAAQSRQLKIALFKLERSLAASLDAFRQQARANAEKLRTGVRAPALGVNSSGAAGIELEAPEEAFYDLLVLSREAEGDGDEEEDDDDDDSPKGGKAGGANGRGGSSTSAADIPTSLRSYLLLLLNLHAVKTYALLESATQELVLLANMPPPQELQQRQQQQQRRDDGDSTWKLDTPLGGGSTSGALLDPKGRPLRPFTITGSTGGAGGDGGSGLLPQDPTAHREQLRKQVFQPSHRLPSMSIDDYLAEEERRGNVLRGGGPEGAAKATPKEERAIRAQLDGTQEGEEAEEEERREKIKWDAWSDEHRRGEGNTMNRG
ncbi:unnamed protein product [Tilletia laevis]|uniref:TAP42-like protein n=2 Tax=Tilletia TaxID=13289 RepID=A0A177TXL3_9BASI|nr:hypothetical protein CF336_g6153 [Tilletia laevis]KAE8264326.1 hypothetical protein A4X03_0g1030 [Tilletia caries]KAE8193923.1 hypothetical protein CF335_g5471 [Tilletia laevis]CAD6885266.1 unnamed protein product [Tilletia caries]CAD6898324.1 unnamed protein product [Tilletia caries]